LTEDSAALAWETSGCHTAAREGNEKQKKPPVRESHPRLVQVPVRSRAGEEKGNRECFSSFSKKRGSVPEGAKGEIARFSLTKERNLKTESDPDTSG